MLNGEQGTAGAVVYYSAFSIHPSAFDSHRFFLDRLIVNPQQLFLVEDHLLPRQPNDIVDVGEFDRVDGARFFAHAAVDAAQLVDVELGRVFLAVVPRRFVRLDVDAARRTGGRAHEAGDALDAALLVLVQPVHAA